MNLTRTCWYFFLMHYFSQILSFVYAAYKFTDSLGHDGSRKLVTYYLTPVDFHQKF